MDNPKQELTDAKFFEEESKVLRTALVATIPIILGGLAILIRRARSDKGE